MTSHDDPTRKVKTTETVFGIIDALHTLDGGRAAEIADHLDLARSTVHDHLATLEGLKYVVKDGDQYRIGLKFLNHGVFARNQIGIAEVAQPALKRVAQETPELVCQLQVEEHGYSIPICKQEGEDAVKTAVAVGTQLPMHTAAGGKAILANLPEERVNEIVSRHGLEQYTKNTITSRENLEEELDLIQERGFALNDCEGITGVRSVGAAIIVDEQVFGAISVPGPKYRISGEFFQKNLPETVLAATNEIELELTDFSNLYEVK